jgi:hypothetical protein
MIVDELYNLEESSGYSLEGSFTPDLVFSKLWLLKELSKITDHVSTMYVLGSWYGNLAILLARFQSLDVDQIINVETNKEFLSTSKKLLSQFGADNVEYMLKDANDIDYRQLGQEGVVVNTSLTDMSGQDWFDNIPTGTLVVLQARDHDPGEQFADPEDIEQKFPFDQVLYLGSLALEDPETDYHRFMVIGIK